MYRFTGVERATIELDGAFDPAALALPSGLAHDGGRVSLFAFHVDRLKLAGVPALSWTYGEVLWRIAVTREGVPSWWVIACDLEAWGPRWAAARWVRYDVRKQRVAVDDTRVISQGAAGELAIEIRNQVAPDVPPEAPRPLRVGRDAGWEVPWGDDGEYRPAVQVRIERDSLSAATLGTPVKWADRVVLRRGRQHRCGVAHR